MCWRARPDGATLAQLAYSSALPGRLGAWFVAASLSCFAFSTILGWAYYGERNIQHLAGSRAVIPYRLAFVAMIVLASVAQLDVVWMASEVLNALMAFPNLIGLVLLSGHRCQGNAQLLQQVGRSALEATVVAQVVRPDGQNLPWLEADLIQRQRLIRDLSFRILHVEIGRVVGVSLQQGA